MNEIPIIPILVGLSSLPFFMWFFFGASRWAGLGVALWVLIAAYGAYLKPLNFLQVEISQGVYNLGEIKRKLQGFNE